MVRHAFQLRKLSESTANAVRVEAEQKSFVARAVVHRLPISRVNEFLSQAQPTVQLLRRLFDRAGPTAARECPFGFGEGRVLADHQKRYTRTLRKRELEIARL